VSASILPLEVEGVEYRVREHVLVDGVSFTLRRGPKSVILGANGAGKSLLLRICHGLLRPTRGSVRYAGGAGPAETRARQAMLFQRPVLLRRSAAANVAWVLAVRGVPRAARRARVREVLEQTGLAALADRPARVLSGGEQHRLALARVWALRPELALLDEPTSSLDPAATRAIEALIEKIHAAGAKIVLTTQDLAQARRLADEVLFLHRGRLLEVAPAERFFADPATPEARAFLRGELLAGY
jgi:tungstate transport system ATP-binding protein